VQDVYLQAWKSFDQFEIGTNCRAWLFKILFHTLNHYRRKWLNIRMVKANEEILDLTPAGGPPIPEYITDEEMLAALADVPQDFLAVVLLVDVEEFSYKEAAGILNVPIGTVMSRLSRGRKLLREKLVGLGLIRHRSYARGRKERMNRFQIRRGRLRENSKVPRCLYQQRAHGGNELRGSAPYRGLPSLCR